jgi:hypothetical protein
MVSQNFCQLVVVIFDGEVFENPFRKPPINFKKHSVASYMISWQNFFPYPVVGVNLLMIKKGIVISVSERGSEVESICLN